MTIKLAAFQTHPTQPTLPQPGFVTGSLLYLGLALAIFSGVKPSERELQQAGVYIGK